ncbi:MAG: DNA polymerase IV [Myxococcaceae bacterium]|nr:DNA polymerase IV [Myxococcaceae bacterium]
MSAIVHIDMDAFYASVEQRDNAQLRGKPVIVGGHPTRGVVLAASYEVRQFGVRSAMPMAQAKKLAPRAIVVPPRMHAYAEASDAVFRLFETVTPLVEPLSLDEAFLDVTASQELFGAPADIARQLRERIRRETGLPASAGIAEVKYVAKVASDLAKPDGQREVPAGTAKAFLAPLPVSRLWGVGPKLEATLQGYGLKLIGDLAAHDEEWLRARLGDTGTHLWQLSQGIDARKVNPDREAKSIGAQETFDADVHGEEALHPHLHAQALRVGRRLRSAKWVAKTVQLTLKYADFTSLTRRCTLKHGTDDGQTLYREACRLLDSVALEKPVRLTGVSAQNLAPLGTQLGLFEKAPEEKTRKLNQALDAIAQRFGSKSIRPADVDGG